MPTRHALWETGLVDEDTIKVPLELLDEPPEYVAGPDAFVLSQPDIGRIEVGQPLPDDEIWNHFTGDLRLTAVRERTGGVAAGGGPARADGQLDLLWSDGSGANPNEGAWVVAGLIPSEYRRVVVEHGGSRVEQRPINGTVAVPLGTGGPVTSFTILGVGECGTETVLHRV